MYDLEDLKFRRKTWMQLAAIPENRIGWTLEDCVDVSPDDLTVIKKWVQHCIDGNIIKARGKNSCGRGLLLFGAPGQGKTALALSILQDLIRTIPIESLVVKPNSAMSRPMYFTTYSSLLDLKGRTMSSDVSINDQRLWSGIMGESVEDAYNVRVLLIDDIGQEHHSGSGWQSSMLHHIIRSRFNNGLPTIVTTNYHLDNLENTYGQATGSFSHEAFVPISLKSPKGDLRKAGSGKKK